MAAVTLGHRDSNCILIPGTNITALYPRLIEEPASPFDEIESIMVHLPGPFDTIPRTGLLFAHPSPIEPLPNLSKALGSKLAVYVKREDCNSGLAFGGNKVRKLEYVLADALASGADTLVTTGGVQSNHMRQTAAAAARLGLKVCPPVMPSCQQALTPCRLRCTLVAQSRT